LLPKILLDRDFQQIFLRDDADIFIDHIFKTLPKVRRSMLLTAGLSTKTFYVEPLTQYPWGKSDTAIFAQADKCSDVLSILTRKSLAQMDYFCYNVCFSNNINLRHNLIWR
jgi:hypothetical protein